jgi:hypothetical protein
LDVLYPTAGLGTGRIMAQQFPARSLRCSEMPPRIDEQFERNDPTKQNKETVLGGNALKIYGPALWESSLRRPALG